MAVRPKATKPAVSAPSEVCLETLRWKNDPAFSSVFDIGGGLRTVKERSTPQHNASLSGMTAILRRAYEEYVDGDSDFGYHVSESMFCLYCVQHVWHRLEFLQDSQGIGYSRRGQLHQNQMASGAFKVPVQFDLLLRSLGPFTLPGTGESYKMNVPKINDCDGWGVVDNNTHYMWMTQPAPHVYYDCVLLTQRSHAEALWRTGTCGQKLGARTRSADCQQQICLAIGLLRT